MTTASLTGRGMTLSDILARWARMTPEAEFLVDATTGERRTYARSDDRITRLATTLVGEGVEPGDRVAVLGLNGVDLLESYIAVLRAGAICVPVNFRLAAQEVAYALVDSGAVVAVADTATADLMAAARDGAPAVRRTITIGGDLEDVLAAADPTYRELAVPDDAPAFIMYTSGTTGRAQGRGADPPEPATCTRSQSTMHLGWPRRTGSALRRARCSTSRASPGFLPVAASLGGTTVIPPSGGFDPGSPRRDGARAGHVMLLRARHVGRDLAVPGRRRARPLGPAPVSWGAAPASTTLLRTLIDDASRRPRWSRAFGQTECSPVTCLLRGEDAIRKIGSVGHADAQRRGPRRGRRDERRRRRARSARSSTAGPW